MYPGFTWLRRFLLRLALGKSTYRYMLRTMTENPVIARARLVDLVARKDAREHRIEADWLKTIARIAAPDWAPPRLKAVPGSATGSGSSGTPPVDGAGEQGRRK